METVTVHSPTENFALLEKCRKGDEAAFRELYQLYNKAMYNLCVRMLNNEEEARDVLQESFVSAFTNIRSYTSKGTFGAWLKRIVINRSIDVIRKRNQQFVQLDDRDIAVEEQEEEPEDYDLETIQAAMAKLPDGYRVILTLFLFEDHTHKMIAERLNISEGTSKSQYSRGRKKLIELIRKISNERQA